MSMQSLPMPGQLALDLASRPPADTTARFIEYLRSEPSPTEVSQEFVLGFLSECNARAAVVSAIEPDATLRLIGHFGLANSVAEDIGVLSLWDPLPAAIAIRQRRPLVLSTFDAVVAAFPAVYEFWPKGHSLVDVPLMTASSVFGSIFVQFETEGTHVANAAQVLEALADIYVLYLLARTRHHPEEQHIQSSVTAFASRTLASPMVESKVPPVAPQELTKRQRLIMQFLSEGFTYDQIAARIGYSHSTVRMELMQMYRLFGVSSRRDAVTAAQRRGLVDQSRATNASLPVGDPLTPS